MWRNDELEYSVSEHGDRIAKFSIDSNMLPVITVDTYQTFTGSSEISSEIDTIVERFGVDADLLDVIYLDQRPALEKLSELALDAMRDQLYADIVTFGSVNSVWSPAYYNFKTDSFNTDIEVNVSELINWIKSERSEVIPALEAYADAHFSSYDGFMSFVTGALRDGRRLGTLIWLGVHMYLADALDWDTFFMAMAEGEREAYLDTFEIVATEHDVTSPAGADAQTCSRCGEPEADTCETSKWDWS